MAPFQRACVYTTRITTKLTTALRTLNFSALQTTLSTICRSAVQPLLSGLQQVWKKLGRLLRSGIGSTQKLRRVSASWLRKPAQAGKDVSPYSTPARTVESCLRDFVEQTSADIAALHVRQQHGLPAELTTKPASALYAEMISGLIATGKLTHAPKIVGVSISPQQPRRVFDLTVGQVHSFYANGVWVSNCAEALQYLMLHIGNASEGHVLQQRREIKRSSPIGWT